MKQQVENVIESSWCHQWAKEGPMNKRNDEIPIEFNWIGLIEEAIEKASSSWSVSRPLWVIGYLRGECSKTNEKRKRGKKHKRCGNNRRRRRHWRHPIRSIHQVLMWSSKIELTLRSLVVVWWTFPINRLKLISFSCAFPINQPLTLNVRSLPAGVD